MVTPGGMTARRDRVVAEQGEAERPAAGGHLPADVAQADQAQRQPGRLAAEELAALVGALRQLPARGQVAGGGGHAPDQHQRERDGQLGHGLRRCGPGALVTGMPRWLAAATSTFTGPPRAQQTSRSGAASSTSALTGAPCTSSASCPGTAATRSAGSPAYSRSDRSDSVRGGAGSAVAELQFGHGDGVAEAGQRRGEHAGRHVAVPDDQDPQRGGVRHG